MNIPLILSVPLDILELKTLIYLYGECRVWLSKSIPSYYRDDLLLRELQIEHEIITRKTGG